MDNIYWIVTAPMRVRYDEHGQSWIRPDQPEKVESWNAMKNIDMNIKRKGNVMCEYIISIHRSLYNNSLYLIQDRTLNLYMYDIYLHIITSMRAHCSRYDQSWEV